MFLHNVIAGLAPAISLRKARRLRVEFGRRQAGHDENHPAGLLIMYPVPGRQSYYLVPVNVG
jgi:hypothetical protein